MSARLPAVPPDPIAVLQAAARLVVARTCLHCIPAQIIIQDAAGNVLLSLAVPVGPVAAEPVPPAPPPVASGWDLDTTPPTFDGRAVPVSGRKLDVLRVLVEHDAATLDDLRAAWAGYAAEESTVRWTVSELKKVLAKVFPDLADPIKATGNGYTLLVR